MTTSTAVSLASVFVLLPSVCIFFHVTSRRPPSCLGLSRHDGHFAAISFCPCASLPFPVTLSWCLAQFRSHLSCICPLLSFSFFHTHFLQHQIQTNTIAMKYRLKLVSLVSLSYPVHQPLMLVSMGSCSQKSMMEPLPVSLLTSSVLFSFSPGVVSQQDNGKTFSVSSTIRIPVERKDNGAALSCEAIHPALSGEKRVQHYRLDVYCECRLQAVCVRVS